MEGNNRNHNSQLPVPLPVPGQEGKEHGGICDYLKKLDKKKIALQSFRYICRAVRDY